MMGIERNKEAYQKGYDDWYVGIYEPWLYGGSTDSAYWDYVEGWWNPHQAEAEQDDESPAVNGREGGYASFDW